MADLALRIDHQAALIELRSAVARLERGTVVTEGETISLCPPIDRLLPAGGLARGAFHEVFAAEPGRHRLLRVCPRQDGWTRSSGWRPSRTSGLQVLRNLVSRSGTDFYCRQARQGRSLGLRGSAEITGCGGRRPRARGARTRSDRCPPTSARRGTGGGIGLLILARHRPRAAFRRQEPLARRSRVKPIRPATRPGV